MRKLFLPLLVAFFLGGAVLSLMQVARGQEAVEPTVLNREAQGENRREIELPAQFDKPEEPAIGFIDSPSATCYQPDPGVDACYLNWYYLSVDAAPNYMITMTLSLNDTGPALHTQGFFQTAMYVPSTMLGDGIKVSCGALGAGGNPLLGKAYAYTVGARDSAGFKSANYGTVYCPAYIP
jgi:hypothetical protein